MWTVHPQRWTTDSLERDIQCLFVSAGLLLDRLEEQIHLWALQEYQPVLSECESITHTQVAFDDVLMHRNGLQAVWAMLVSPNFCLMSFLFGWGLCYQVGVGGYGISGTLNTMFKHTHTHSDVLLRFQCVWWLFWYPCWHAWISAQYTPHFGIGPCQQAISRGSMLVSGGITFLCRYQQWFLPGSSLLTLDPAPGDQLLHGTHPPTWQEAGGCSGGSGGCAAWDVNNADDMLLSTLSSLPTSAIAGRSTRLTSWGILRDEDFCASDVRSLGGLWAQYWQ